MTAAGPTGTALRPAAAPPAPGGGGRAPRTVFLLPGLFGDEPKLQDLRDRLSGVARIVTLPLPDAGAPLALLSDMAAMARASAEEVGRRQASGPVAIVGFSFGASVALEVAAQLGRAGRAVDRLCLIEGVLKPRHLRRPAGTLLRLALTPRGAVELMGRVRRRIDDRIGLARVRLRPESVFQSQAAHDVFVAHTRHLALEGWRPPACPAPGVIILSGSLSADGRRQWAELCPNLRVAPVETDHNHLLVADGALDAVAAILRRELQAADGAGEPLTRSASPPTPRV